MRKSTTLNVDGVALKLFRAYIYVPAPTGYPRDLMLDLWEDIAKHKGALAVDRGTAVIKEIEYIAEKDVYIYQVTGPAIRGDERA